MKSKTAAADGATPPAVPTALLSSTLRGLDRDAPPHMLIARRGAADLHLTGPNGPLKRLTKIIVEAALDEEMHEHLGYDRGDRAGRNGGNSRNGLRSKTIMVGRAGPVVISVPRDRDGTFEPHILVKRSRRTAGLDALILLLSANGFGRLRTSAVVRDLYGSHLPPEAIDRIAQRLIAEMDPWWTRPLLTTYPAVSFESVDIRNGYHRTYASVHAAIAHDAFDRRSVLGIWEGNAESVAFWVAALSDLRARGMTEIAPLAPDTSDIVVEAVQLAYPAHRT